jgi:hypothetical protein
MSAESTQAGPVSLTPEETNRLAKWRGKLKLAEDAYKAWDDIYHTTELEEMYLGHQWSAEEAREQQGSSDTVLSRSTLYTMNLFFPAIESRRPDLLFDYPQIHISPRATRTDDPSSTIEPRCRLLSDTANTYLSDPRKSFKDEAELALQESFFRFGVMETGYEVTGTEENPDGGQPLLAEDGKTESTTSEGQPILQPKVNITEEEFYFRRIPASQFRVGYPSKNRLLDNDWVGYYEWVHLDDLKAHPMYENTEYLKGTGSAVSGGRPVEAANLVTPSDDDHGKGKDRVKVWKVWDLRKMVRHVFPDSMDFFLLMSKPFSRLPLRVLKFHEILDQFYPLPPVFNWMSPQKEYNEVREMSRVHRKRFYRRYLVKDGAFKDGELEKLETGGDGVYALIESGSVMDALAPVPDAPLDRAMTMSIPSTKEDFTQISGVSGEQRMVTSSSTATQASILEQSSKIRGGVMRSKVARFLAEVATILLENIVEYATLPLLIRTHVDPTSPGAAMEAQSIAATWQKIQAVDLTKIDFEWEATVDIESIAPPTSDDERQTWDRVLQILSNPQMCIVLSASDTLFRMTMRRWGVTSAAYLADIRQAMQQLIQMNQPPPPGAAPQGPGAPHPPMPPGAGPRPQPGISGGSIPGAPGLHPPAAPIPGPGAPMRGAHNVPQQLSRQMPNPRG